MHRIPFSSECLADDPVDQCTTLDRPALNEKEAQEILNRLKKKAQQRPQNAMLTPEQRDKKQLPLWPDAVRGVPNILLRSSLFAVNKARDQLRKPEILASTTDIEVYFVGEGLNQTDLDVWVMILHLARLQPLGHELQFSVHSFLKALGRGTGAPYYEQLNNEVARLRGGIIKIIWKNEKKTFVGSLVAKATRHGTTQKNSVVLDEKLLRLFDSGYTYINWEQRHAFKSNLTKWLHGFYSSHARPYKYKVGTLRDLCGSRTKELRKFRQMLKVSLGELVVAGLIKDWEITSADLVSVTVIPSKSQARHLNKKRAASKR